jgi:putative ABC transport system ATP-binding protein
MALFDRLNTAGRTIVLITHEHDIAEHAQRAIRLMDGQIVSDERNGARDFSHLAHPRAQTGSTS